MDNQARLHLKELALVALDQIDAAEMLAGDIGKASEDIPRSDELDNPEAENRLSCTLIALRAVLEKARSMIFDLFDLCNLIQEEPLPRDPEHEDPSQADDNSSEEE